MDRHERVLRRIAAPGAVQNVRFDDLCRLLRRLGFDERQRGSHHIFTKATVASILNLQGRPDGTAKPYQVRQVRALLATMGVLLDHQENQRDER